MRGGTGHVGVDEVADARIIAAQSALPMTAD
jgi:hypothetical protein